MTIYDKWKILRACCGVRGGYWSIGSPWREGCWQYASDRFRGVRFLTAPRRRLEPRHRTLPHIASLFELSGKAVKIGEYCGADLQVPWTPRHEDDDESPLIGVGEHCFDSWKLRPLADAGKLTLYLDKMPRGAHLLADFHEAKGSFLAMCEDSRGRKPVLQL